MHTKKEHFKKFGVYICSQERIFFSSHTKFDSISNNTFSNSRLHYFRRPDFWKIAKSSFICATLEISTICRKNLDLLSQKKVTDFFVLLPQCFNFQLHIQIQHFKITKLPKSNTLKFNRLKIIGKKHSSRSRKEHFSLYVYLKKSYFLKANFLVSVWDTLYTISKDPIIQ